MKKDQPDPSKHRSNASRSRHENGRCVVQIEFSHPEAAAVAIAGTFNDWHPAATPMVAMGAGRWLKQLVLPPGQYEYRFVADGQWMPDPLARAAVPNPFGGVNSVLTVTRAANGHRKQKR